MAEFIRHSRRIDCISGREHVVCNQKLRHKSGPDRQRCYRSIIEKMLLG